jgi:hypothetical protein
VTSRRHGGTAAVIVFLLSAFAEIVRGAIG